MMRDRYINFIYALVIGRSIKGSGKFDIWDCEEGVMYFVDIVMPCLLPDKMICDYKKGYHPFAVFLKEKYFNNPKRKEEEDEELELV